MALDTFVNFGRATVAPGFAAGATSFSVVSGADLPAGPAWLTIWNTTDYADPADDPDKEIVRATVSGNTVSMVGGAAGRGQQGTTDVNHNTGGKTYRVAQAITASDLNTGLPETFQSLKGPTPFVNALAPEFFVSNSTVTTDGTITSGTPNLVVVDSSSWLVGQGIYVIGAGAAAAVLETTVLAIPSGTAITLAANASTTVSSGTNNVGHSDTVGIQAALDFAESANVGSAGAVHLPSGVYNVSGITIPHECWLVGNGPRNTRLESIPGATALGVVIMDDVSKGCGLINLTIDGNNTATPAPTGDGLHITSTLTAGLRNHVIENVDIFSAAGDGVNVALTGANLAPAMFFRNVYSQSNAGHGFNLHANTTDNLFVACSCGLNGGNGWNVLGGANHFIGCLSEDSTGDGWVFSGTGCTSNVLAGCRAANQLGNSVVITGNATTNYIDIISHDPVGDHLVISGSTPTNNTVRMVCANPITSPLSGSVANISGGVGNVLDLDWPSNAIAGTALTGAALDSQVIRQNGAYRGASDLTLLDGSDLVLGTSTGSKIGTATTQKLGFFNATPIVQAANTTDLRTLLINFGLLETGGASPLNLNGGALIAASATLSGMTLGSIVFASTSGLLAQDNANLFWDDTNKRLGLGTTAPIFPVHVSTDSAGVKFGTDSYVSSAAIPSMRFRRSRGTAASPSALSAADVIGGISVVGRYDNSNWSTVVGQFQFAANQSFTSANQGTNFNIFVGQDNTAGTLINRLAASTRGVQFNADALASRSTTNGVGVIDVYNSATAPVGTLTSGISLYVTAGELFVMDAGGTPTQLSPHDPVTREWIFNSRNAAGRSLKIDVERMLRKLDAMLGGGYIHEGDPDAQ